jgi:citrate lyase subunit beta / citryl-CoA lyase
MVVPTGQPVGIRNLEEMLSVSPRLRRSELAVPASNPKMIGKAAGAGADLVFLDLEDAVAPTQKAAARQNVIDGFSTHDWGSTVRCFRMNGVHTEWAVDDLTEVIGAAGNHIDVVMVPMVRSPRDIWFVETLLSHLERKHRLERPIAIEALIEEAEALANVESIAAASPRLEALILGFGDLSASLGMRAGRLDYPGDVWHHARARMIAAARSHGVEPIDGPYPVITDSDGYRVEANSAAALGAAGKWCLHPSQIPIANEVFAPTAQEVDHAVSALNAIEAAVLAGSGVAVHNGTMVDAASARVFEATVQRALACGMAVGELRTPADALVGSQS